MQTKTFANFALLALLTAAAPVTDYPKSDRFSCDTPGGHFSVYERDVPPGPISITATVKFNKIYLAEPWSPVAYIYLSNGDQKNELGVKLIPSPDLKEIATKSVFLGQDGQFGNYIGKFNQNSGVKLSIRTSLSSTTIQSGDKIQSRDVGGLPIWKLHVSCSGADVHFDDIEISRN